MHQHPTPVKRKPPELQMVRAKCSCAEVINHWFIEISKPILDDLELHDRPKRIINIDEVGFPLSDQATSVLVKKGMKSQQSLNPGPGRENITDKYSTDQMQGVTCTHFNCVCLQR